MNYTIKSFLQMARQALSALNNSVRMNLFNDITALQMSAKATRSRAFNGKRTNEEFITAATCLLKQCANWRQVYRLFKLTKNRLGWNDNKADQIPADDISQLLLSVRFDLAIIFCPKN